MHVVSTSELIVILAFVSSVLLVYGAAVYFLVKRFVNRKQPTPLNVPAKLVLSAACIITGCIFYALLVEPFQLEITEHKLALNKLPPATTPNPTPIRIVQISDLHCDPVKRLEDRLPQTIASLHPDLVLFTGDATNSMEGAPNFYDCIQKIMKIAPTYGVKGDWDFAMNFDTLAKAGVTKVPNGQVVTIRGAKLWLIGVDNAESCKDALAKSPKDMPVIFMYHSPDADIIKDKTITGVDLYCCGHTHGGQIALPLIGPLITQSVLGYEYARGMHNLNGCAIYTNRGIGMEGHFPRMRFFSKPEIAVFDLVPKS